jgi:phage terminase large subunit-like protein
MLPNGSRIKGFTAEKPDRLRGPQHHGAWCDELAAWTEPDTYDQLQFGLRLGTMPQVLVTTTPRPTKIVKELIKDPDTVIIRGSTYENKDNLAASTLVTLQTKYENTRLGRQELFGEVLDDNPGALWTRATIESARIKINETPPFTRVVVGIDPAVSNTEDSDSTGIVTCGMTADGHYYVLDDSTLKGSPQEWATVAVQVYERFKADRIVAETNNGGDLVIHLLQQVKPGIATKKVTATRGKQLRAEPIAALYEQGRVHHIGYFAKLEDEMCEYEPGVSADSPDRMDSLVWALTELSEGSNAINFFASMANFCSKCKIPVSKFSSICPACNTPIGVNNDLTLAKPNT